MIAERLFCCAVTESSVADVDPFDMTGARRSVVLAIEPRDMAIDVREVMGPGEATVLPSSSSNATRTELKAKSWVRSRIMRS